MSHYQRSIAFSNKQKKEQLKAKRERKRNVSTSENDKPIHYEDKRNSRSLEQERKISQSTSRHPNNSGKEVSSVSTGNFYLESTEEIQGGGASSKHNKHNLKFRKLHTKDKDNLKKLQYVPVAPLPQEELEVSSATFYPSGLDYPKRPSWMKNISKAELDVNENLSFRLFCEEIHKEYNSEELSLFELNLETWRQLWRVTEMSDIVLVIVDARFVAAQFPPYLYNHLVTKENKGVILLMNKCDLIDPSLVLAWQDFCKEHYPRLIVVPFSSMEGKTLKKSTMKIAMNSSLKLIEACQKLVDGNVNLNPWRRKVEKEIQDESSAQCEILSEHSPETTGPIVYQRYKDNILTIGTIGYPNVGKSSLINALMGKKVVSVSKTPGHTKHFQTIFITKEIKLCDCPGLVFPSLCPKQLQVILGSYPIAQVRDPYSAIHYIACRIDLPFILHLRVVDQEDTPDKFEWTPFYICEAWAKRRGFFIRGKGGRPDVSRAANELLRFTLVGLKSLIVSLRPMGFSRRKENYDADPRLAEITLIQGSDLKNTENSPLGACEEDDDDSQDSESNDENDNNDHEDSEEDDDSCYTSQQNKFAALSLNDF